MASILSRNGRLYAKIKDINDKWRRLRTPFVDGQLEQAEKWAEQREQKIESLRKLKPSGESGPLTVLLYARAWLDKRRTKTVKDDRTRLELHVLPRIGHLLVVDVRPRHLRDVIEALKAAGHLAPKTIREVSGLMHTMFESAIIDEVIKENPVKYEKGVLPKKLDKDPSWRRQAIYVRPEIEQLFSDERVPADRRILYALKFFAGRHSEVAAVKWEQWDTVPKPLGALAIDDTKTLVPRLIPVHPTFAKMLAAWKLYGWEEFYGRKPTLDDLIVPTKKFTRRDPDDSQLQLLYDLRKLGLRTKAGKKQNRRGHDLRRTFITLARADGAIDSLLRWVTHGPKPSEILDTYSTPPWESLCTEVGKLKIALREGQVIAMAANDPISSSAGTRGPGLVQARKTRATPGLEAVLKRPGRDSNPPLQLFGDTPREESREVGVGRVAPNGAEDGGLDQTVVQELKALFSGAD